MFKIYFPRVAESLRAMTPDAFHPEDGSNQRTVLLVDDETVVRDMLSEFLTTSGYTVVSARSGEQALALVRQRKVVPDLLITDFELPGMNGQQLAKAVRADHPTTKVLVVSGYGEDAIVDRGHPLIGSQFLQKPFSLNVLGKLIREIMDE
jgi:two-component system cell cycle sensor histidine kinase/response regulator CckA